MNIISLYVLGGGDLQNFRTVHPAAGALCLAAFVLTFLGIASMAPAQSVLAAPPVLTAPPVADVAPAQSVAPAPIVATTPSETRELWTGDLYSSSYRAGLCLSSDGTLRGVLLLRVPSGKVDVYHFQGEHGAGRVSARHSSGHSFSGEFDGEGEVSGTIKLKSGFTVKLKGQRTHGVELTETCRPLPQE